MYIIRASLSEPHYMMSTVKSVFLLAWYITPYMKESRLSANYHCAKHMYINGPLCVAIVHAGHNYECAFKC